MFARSLDRFDPVQILFNNATIFSSNCCGEYSFRI